MALLSSLMTLGIPARIALVVGFLALIGACVATVLPAQSDDGSDCGFWFAPDYSDANTDALLRQARELYGAANRSGDAVNAGKAIGIAANIQRAADQCGGELDGRRNVALGLAALAMIGPPVIMFTAGGRRSPRPRST